MWDWLKERAVPRYAFYVVLLALFARLAGDPYNHWPRTPSEWKMFIGTVLFAILLTVVFWLWQKLSQRHRSTPPR